MQTIATLAKLAAEKQAFAPVLRGAAKPLLNSAGQLAKSVIRPTFKPKPEFVSQAASRLAANPPGAAARALNYVANVPKGEVFSQRPVRNTVNLLKFDGLPFMRQLGRATLAGTGLYGAHSVNETNKWINQNIEEAAKALESKVNPVLRTTFDWQSALMGAKRDFLYDQTVGALGRYFAGDNNPRQKQFEAVLRDVAYDATGRYLQEPGAEKPNLLQRIKQWRNPQTVAASASSSMVQNLLPKPKPALQLAADVFKRLQTAGVEGPPTTLEKITANRFGPAFDNVPPAAKQTLYKAVAKLLASNDTGIAR